MNLQELLMLLSETADEASQREILVQHRELLNDEFIQQGAQQAEALTKAGRHTAALQLADSLVTACAVKALAQWRGKALVAKAKALDGAQRWDNAMAVYEEAHRFFEEAKDRKGMADCELGQGRIYNFQGEFDKALASFQRAQPVFEGLDIRDKVAACVQNQGFAHDSHGEYEKALACYKRAQVIFEQLGIRHKVADCVLNQGVVHRSRGECDVALACDQQAQAVYEELVMKDGVADCMMNQGNVYLDRGEYDAALEYHKQAQAIFEELDIKDGVARCMMNQGVVHDHHREYDEALKCHEEAQAVFEKLGMKDWTMKTSRGKGDVYRLLGQHDAALQCYTQAQEERPIDQLWYPEIQWQVQYGLAKLYSPTPQALDYYDESLAIIDTLRVRQQTDWTKMGVLHNKEAVYADAIRWCLDRSKAEAYLPKAFNYTERAKARALLDLMDQTQPELRSEDANVQTRLLLLKRHQIEQGRLREAEDFRKAAELSASIQQTQRELAELNPDEKMLRVYGKPSEALSKRFKKLQTVTGTAATIEGVTEWLGEQPWDVVYFYGHAAHPDNPMLSFIELSDTSGGTPQAARLRAVDILNLRLDASLVVLGACETAVGARRPGDDIVSLTRAFFRAGTPSVLSSLWKVPARDTATLLKYFYLDENSGWLSGVDKAVALQAAQQEILLGEPHPYYWAGFVLYGDWS